MTDIQEYCQEKGLRILAVDAFKFFLENLGQLPGNYLEIGVFEGVMLRELAKAYPNKMFYGIDPFIEDGNTTGHTGIPKGERLVAQSLVAYGNFEDVLNITFCECTSRVFAKALTDEMIDRFNIGSVFVDGDHSYEEALHDLILACRLLKNGGMIYVDDEKLPSVAKAIADFPTMIKQLIGNRVLIEPVMEETAAGFVVPEEYRTFRIGIVKAVGNGRRLKNGERENIEIEVGAKVVLSTDYRMPIEIDGKQYFLVSPEKVMAQIPNDTQTH